MKNSCALKVFIIFLFLFTISACSAGEETTARKPITAPPESLDVNDFYKKYLDVDGIAVTSSEKVADEALYEVDNLIHRALANRPDILESMANAGTRIVVIGANEPVSTIPEYFIADPQRAEQQNRRVRGYGGRRLTSCGEENLLNYEGDRYIGENIFLHEFGHCIHNHLRRLDRSFQRKLHALYEDARERGLWQRTYAITNASEYWAEGVQNYWDCNRQSRRGGADGVHNDINTREEMQEYDPNLYQLIDETIGPMEWRYANFTDRNPQYVIDHPERYDVEKTLDGKVTAIPQSIVDKFELDTTFYKKMISSGGLPIMGSVKVDDKAFYRADELVKKLLAGRKDILEAMINSNVRLVIIAAEEGASEIPEYYLDDPQARAYQDERVRGYGGRMTSFGEENLLCLPIDRYDDENIMIHEFGGHCVDSTVSRMDRDFRRELRRLYREAIARGLYKDTYAGSNQAEYWAEAVQDYFDADRQNNWNHNFVNTREELMAYDPNMCEFVARVFNLSSEQDWRYKPMAVQPAVTTPPEKLKADKFYTKYVDCRSLPVMGSAKVSDEALLKANQLIRNMFTYRHDILKAMIDKGLRVVVLAEDQNINVVPECAALSTTERCITIEKPEFRIVIGQDYVLTPEKHGENMLMREFAKAIVTNVANRPFDQDFEEMSDRRKQQYELYGVVRVDERFAKKLDELYNDAKEKGLWKGTPAQTNAVEYFAEGVQSWFDGNSKVKDNAGKTINTRAELKKYDPALAEFIADTFKHTQREGFDWRCTTAAATEAEKKTASEYLQELSAATKRLKDYSCRISYLHAQPLFETKSLRKGQLFYKKDGQKSFLRINFETLKEDNDAEQEYRDEYIFDGRWLTHIDYKVKQVKRTEQAEEGKEIDSFELIRQSFPIIGFTKVEELAEQFEIGEPEAFSTKAGDFVLMDLKPKAGTDYAEDYKSIEFQINSQLDLPYRIIAVSTEPEDESDYYQIELTKAKIDREINRKIFEYEIPQGFTVETQPLEG